MDERDGFGDDVVLTEREVAQLGEEGFFVRDGFLGEECARNVHKAVQKLYSEEVLKRAGMARGAQFHVDDDQRGDLMTWLDDHPERVCLQRLRQGFEALRDALNRQAYLGLGIYDVQLAHFPGHGARYVRHRDSFIGRQNRLVTAVCYLNPYWRADYGGELRIHLPPNAERMHVAHAVKGSEPQLWLDVEPRLDRLVVFLSEEVEHEVLPTFAPRSAATCWFRSKHQVRVTYQ